MEQEFKIFVGGLPWEATGADLEKLFSGIGITPVSAEVVMDNMTNRSRGFGFVRVASQEEIDKAVSELDQKEFELGGNRRTLTVNEARPRSEQ